MDELFCGYDRYRSRFDFGLESVMEFMDEKLTNEFHLVSEVSRVVDMNHIKSIQPFLTKKFIDFSKKIPLEYKITGSSDRLRKHIIREIATDLGVPKESATYPKKALQYGSLIHKNLLKVINNEIG